MLHLSLYRYISGYNLAMLRRHASQGTVCSADITGVLSTAVWLLPASPDRFKSVNSLWHGNVLRCAVLGLSVQQELPGILHEVSFLGVKRRLLLDNLLNRTDTHIASVSSLRTYWQHVASSVAGYV